MKYSKIFYSLIFAFMFLCSSINVLGIPPALMQKYLNVLTNDREHFEIFLQMNEMENVTLDPNITIVLEKRRDKKGGTDVSLCNPIRDLNGKCIAYSSFRICILNLNDSDR